MATLEQIKALKKKHSQELLQQPGVCGVDIDIKKTGEAALMVHLDTKNKKTKSALPKEIEGYPIEYVYTGPIHKQ